MTLPERKIKIAEWGGNTALPRRTQEEVMKITEDKSSMMPKLILMIGVFCCSLSSAFVKMMTAPSSVAATYRLGMAVLMLTPYVFINKKSRTELFSLSKKDVAFCSASGFFFAFHLFVWFESLKHTSVASSTVLCNTEVVFAAIGYILFFGKKLKTKEFVAIGVALLGTVIVATSDHSGGGGALWGDFLATLAAVLTAAYTLIGTRQRDHISTTVYTYILYFASFITLIGVDLATGTPMFGYEPINWLMAFCLALFCNLMGHSVFSWSLKYLKPTYVSTVKLAGPVFASINAIFLFHEIPGLTQLIGALVVIAGVAMYARQEQN